MLLGLAQATTLDARDARPIDEMMIDISHRAQNAMKAKAAARWVELPNCKPLPPPKAVLEIPLEDDLSNASIATCKQGPDASWFEAAPTPPAGSSAADIAKMAYAATFNPQIYDPVIHEHWNEEIIDYEHQVTQQANGHYDPTDGADGPAGAFLKPPGTPVAPRPWAPLAPVPLRPMNSQLPPPRPRWEAPQVDPVKQVDPYDSSLMQLADDAHSLAQSSWVELPDCKGDDGEVKLHSNLDNKTVATCKDGAKRGTAGYYP